MRLTSDAGSWNKRFSRRSYPLFNWKREADGTKQTTFEERVVDGKGGVLVLMAVEQRNSWTFGKVFMNANEYQPLMQSQNGDVAFIDIA